MYTKGGARGVVIWLGNIPKAHFALEICAQWKGRKAADEAHLIDYDDEEAEVACRSIFIDPPWWSCVWNFQEIIHSSAVLVYVGAETSTPSTPCAACMHRIRVGN